MIQIFIFGFVQFYSFIFLTKYSDYIFTADYSLLFLGSLQAFSLLCTALLRKHLHRIEHFSFLVFIALYVLSSAQLNSSIGLLAICLLAIFVFFQACLFRIMTAGKEKIQKIYFVELYAGALGVLAWFHLSRSIGFPGFAALVVLAHLVFSFSFFKSNTTKIIHLILAVGLLIAIQEPQPVFNKRERYQLTANSQLVDHFWDPNAHIEVAQTDRVVYLLFDGGIFRSTIYQFDGNFPSFRQTLENGHATYLWGLDVAAPHFLIGKPDYSAALISAVGGQEILAAKAFQAGRIHAIDINRAAQDQVAGPFNEYSGKVYDNVQVINLDGRKFIENSDQIFDVIQIYSASNASYSSILGPELMATSLFTVEALKTYNDHLSPDGILAVTRYSYLKIKQIFIQAFGEDLFTDSRRMLAFKRKSSGFELTSFLFKKNGWTESDVQKLSDWLSKDESQKWEILFNPYDQSHEITDLKPGSKYQKIASTDDRPFSYLQRSPYEIKQFLYLLGVLASLLILQVGVQYHLKQVSVRRQALAFSMGAGFAVTQSILTFLIQRTVGNPAFGLALAFATLLVTTGLAGQLYCRGFRPRWLSQKYLALAAVVIGIVSKIWINENTLVVIISILVASFVQSFFFNDLLNKDRDRLVTVMLSNGLGLSFGFAFFYFAFISWGLSIAVICLAGILLISGLIPAKQH